MKRVLLDTNIYGRIVERRDVDLILVNIRKSNILIYGSDVVRKELRDTPKEKILIDKNKRMRMRILLLNLYDTIIGHRQLRTTELIRNLAENYYLAYKKFNGKYHYEELLNDFLLVATASIHNLDIVYSEDNRTMVSIESLKSYDLVNSIKRLKTPKFKIYEELKNEIR